MTATDTPLIFAGGSQDWDEILAHVQETGEQRLIVNLGPQHPSTHGALRVILESEGETVVQATAAIGYLHTGIEKNCECRTGTQGVTSIDSVLGGVDR